mmetsp:Transcript_26487/g.56359  ORF Transcript_26487/g.56359 Transcript_26487/m.56359 type:complete len:106 (+) Transcript_26487:602-919(+)
MVFPMGWMMTATAAEIEEPHSEHMDLRSVERRKNEGDVPERRGDMKDAFEDEVGRHCFLLDCRFSDICGRRYCHQPEVLALDSFGALRLGDVDFGLDLTMGVSSR